METLTKEKLIEILKKRIRLIEDWIDIEQFEDIASEILNFHESEIAKYKELVEAWRELDKIQQRNFWKGTFKEYSDKVQEFRRKIDELNKEIGGEK